MAREAIEIDKPKVSRRFACADTPAITKGTFLQGTDPRTASASTGTGDFFIGFAHADKEASDGSTSITVDKGGIYDLTASGVIVKGQKVKTAAPGNFVMAALDADVTSSYQIIIGVALENATPNEWINVEVFP